MRVGSAAMFTECSPTDVRLTAPRVETERTKDTIVTAGQELIEQGRQQGFQQQLLRQVRQRFGAEVDSHVEQRITTASVEQIDSWTSRLLSAATIAELFAD